MKLFGKSDVNIKRQFEFDVEKSLDILVMICLHCFQELSIPSAKMDGTAFHYGSVILKCFFSATNFMMCMGVGIAYSRNTAPEHFIKRGCFLFFLGYLLDFGGFGIPYIVLHLLGRLSLPKVIVRLLRAEIFSFAGLTLMLFGFLKKYKFSDVAIFVIALVMSLVGSCFRYIDMGHYAINCLAGLFFGTYDPNYSYAIASFPLLNWFIVVTIGYLYGKLLRRCTDLNRYYAIAIPASALITFLYMAIIIPSSQEVVKGCLAQYYQMSTFTVFIHFFGLIFLTGIFHFLSKPFSAARKIITALSQNVALIYYLQWTIIAWIETGFIYFRYDGLKNGQLFLLGILIYLLIILLVTPYKKYKAKEL